MHREAEIDAGEKCALDEAYQNERQRLFALAAADRPQGEYRKPVFGEGMQNAKIMLIGEAPGAEETKLARPFIGKAGKQLDTLFCGFGVMRADVYVTNVVKYRPVVRSDKSVRNRTPSTLEVKASLPLLKREIELIEPKLILTLGNTPLKAAFALSGKKPPVIGDVHGQTLTISIGAFNVMLIPLYHPASGIYNRALVKTMEQDAAAVGAFAKTLS